MDCRNKVLHLSILSFDFSVIKKKHLDIKHFYSVIFLLLLLVLFFANHLVIAELNKINKVVCKIIFKLL